VTLPELIANAVKQANAKLAPARASCATDEARGLAFNRRFHMKDGSVGWNPGNSIRIPFSRLARPILRFRWFISRTAKAAPLPPT
jgi:hypothetical protein